MHFSFDLISHDKACILSSQRAVTLLRAKVLGNNTYVQEIFEHFFRLAAAYGMVATWADRTAGSEDRN